MKRQGKPEIYMREAGRKPYSYYLVNKVTFQKDENKFRKLNRHHSEGYFKVPALPEQSSAGVTKKDTDYLMKVYAQ